MNSASKILGICMIVVEIIVCALGVSAFVILAFNNFDPEVFFRQMGNISSRFLASDVARRSEFLGFVGTIWIVIVALISLMKAPAILREIKGGKT